MWRRLCIDVDADGTIIGGSVEIYSDEQLTRDAVLVMEPGWADAHTLVTAVQDLEANGWLQPPLRIVTME